ncbi:MAG: MerR family DNA-binding transcriptional regulator [Rhizobiaceae bacterium]|jgi:DNA-binding transcriptional MerR regulator|nr:MerR family DNA-binding transcriptional regulator [Rhizobiaceae bacterium]
MAFAMQKFDHDSVEAEDLSRIGEIADEFDVTLRTLRFYEDRGLIAPKRVGTARLYGRRERARLRLILLGRDVGLSLDDIRELLDLYEPTSGNKAQLTLALEKSTAQLSRLHDQRKSIDEAIARLDDVLDIIREKLKAAQ